MQQQPLVGIDEAQEDLLRGVLRLFFLTEKLTGPSQDLTPISPVQSANARAGPGFHAHVHEHGPYPRPPVGIPRSYASARPFGGDAMLDFFGPEARPLN